MIGLAAIWCALSQTAVIIITAGTDIAAMANDKLITTASIAGRAFFIACFILLPSFG